MKFTERIKKFTAISLAGTMIFLTANVLSVQAQSISGVSISKPGYGIVSTSDGAGVNVRNAPSLTDSEIIMSAPAYSYLMVVGESGDFYKVQYDIYGHYGYVSKQYFFFSSQQYYLQANTTSKNLNMRSAPSTSAAIVASIPRGTGFAYWDEVQDWYQGVYGNVSGYTSKDYTSRIEYQ